MQIYKLVPVDLWMLPGLGENTYPALATGPGTAFAHGLVSVIENGLAKRVVVVFEILSSCDWA